MTSPARPTLLRELGRWDLTAIGVNQVIGAGIFATPGTVAAYLGGWSWLAVFAVGFAAMFIALCFAEAGSRFEGTGGKRTCTPGKHSGDSSDSKPAGCCSRPAP